MTGNPRYLYLAEDLWSFLTRFAWSKACGGALIQHEGKNRRGVSSTQDTTSNVLYLRLSAWLYTLAAPQNQSAAQKYLAGTGGAHGAGGARAVARWLAGSASQPGTATRAPAKLISGPYRSVLRPNTPSRSVGTPGSRFMILGHLDQSCKAFGSQMWLHTQGVAVAAFTDLAAADKLADDGAGARYYGRLADNLAETVATNEPKPSQSPPGDIGSYFTPGSRPVTPPTADPAGILSEPCLPTVGSPRWPAGCKISFTLRSGGKSQRADAPYLPNKGIFIRAAYCVAAEQGDAALTRFISANAASVWQHDQNNQLAPTPATNDNLFGFRWDSSFAANDVPLNFALETSALEALDAGLGGSTAMC